ncbi:hypothetical protein RCL1_003674 [Eukaryota sp. TZLM3-RCL]
MSVFDIFGDSVNPHSFLEKLAANFSIDPPFWLNDDAGSHCLRCASEFSTIRRKHHCRFCLLLICSKCTATISPVRICSYCMNLPEVIVSLNSTHNFALNTILPANFSKPELMMLSEGNEEIICTSPLFSTVRSFLKIVLSSMNIVNDWKIELSAFVSKSVYFCNNFYAKILSSSINFLDSVNFLYVQSNRISIKTVEGLVLSCRRSFPLVGIFPIILLNCELIFPGNILELDSLSNFISKSAWSLLIVQQLLYAFNFNYIFVNEDDFDELISPRGVVFSAIKIDCLIIDALEKQGIVLIDDVSINQITSLSNLIGVPIVPSISLLNPSLPVAALQGTFTANAKFSKFNRKYLIVNNPYELKLSTILITGPFIPSDLIKNLSNLIRISAIQQRLPFSTEVINIIRKNSQTTSSLVYLPPRSTSSILFIDSPRLPLLANSPLLPFLPQPVPFLLRPEDFDMLSHCPLSKQVASFLSLPSICAVFCLKKDDTSLSRHQLCVPYHHRVLYPYSNFDCSILDWIYGLIDNQSNLIDCNSSALYSADSDLFEVFALEKSRPRRCLSFCRECSGESLINHFSIFLTGDFGLKISVFDFKQRKELAIISKTFLSFNCKCGHQQKITDLSTTTSFSHLVSWFLTGTRHDTCQCGLKEPNSYFLSAYTSLFEIVLLFEPFSISRRKLVVAPSLMKSLIDDTTSLFFYDAETFTSRLYQAFSFGEEFFINLRHFLLDTQFTVPLESSVLMNLEEQYKIFVSEFKRLKTCFESQTLSLPIMQHVVVLPCLLFEYVSSWIFLFNSLQANFPTTETPSSPPLPLELGPISLEDSPEILEHFEPFSSSPVSSQNFDQNVDAYCPSILNVSAPLSGVLDLEDSPSETTEFESTPCIYRQVEFTKTPGKKVARGLFDIPEKNSSPPINYYPFLPCSILSSLSLLNDLLFSDSKNVFIGKHTIDGLPTPISPCLPMSAVCFALNSLSYKSSFDALGPPNLSTANEFLLEKISSKYSSDLAYWLFDSTSTTVVVPIYNQSEILVAEVTVHFARQFEALRQIKFGSKYLDFFIHSLSTLRPWGAEGGKSRSQFHLSEDKSLVAKDGKSSEVDSFTTMSGEIFQHYCLSLLKERSVLMPILGVYSIKWMNHLSEKSPNYFIVTDNLRGADSLTLYDLKGSLLRRKAKTGTKVFLDEDFIADFLQVPLTLTVSDKNRLLHDLSRDTALLEKFSIVDYSLLVGISNNEVKVGVIDYVGKYNTLRQVETVVKRSYVLNPHGRDPTIVDPHVYRSRFLTGMDYYFISVPDESTTIPNYSQFSI